MTGVAQIGEQRAGRIVEDVQTAFLRDVAEAAAPIISYIGGWAGRPAGRRRFRPGRRCRYPPRRFRSRHRHPGRKPGPGASASSGTPLASCSSKEATPANAAPVTSRNQRAGAAREGFLDRLEVRQCAVPGELPDADAVLEFARVLAADVVAQQPAGQGVEARSPDGAQRGPPFLPTGDGIAAAIEDGDGHVGRDVPVFDGRGRCAAAPVSQRQLAGFERRGQARLHFHGGLLAGEFVASRLGEGHDGGVGRLPLELDRERRRGMGGPGEPRRRRAGGQEFAALHGGADPLVRSRPPGRLLSGSKYLLIPSAKSGTRASRADQGVRPTCARES